MFSKKRKSVTERAAAMSFMLMALCLRDPGVRALPPRAVAVKTEYWQGVCAFTDEGPLHIHSCAAKSANRFWIATTLKHMAAGRRAEQLLKEQNKRELAKRYAAVWR